jgi:hypothetical protein
MLVSPRRSQESGGVGASDRVGHTLKVTVLEIKSQEPINPPQPAAPTNALPGSPAKIGVLAQRYSAGLQMWNLKDATRDSARIEQRAGDGYTGQRRSDGRRRQMRGKWVQVF